MYATKTRTIKWTKSCTGGSRFVFLRSCKLIDVSIGRFPHFIVERVTERTPASVIGNFDTLKDALAAIDAEPEARCFGCGQPVVPGYQFPDLNCPDRK